MRLIDYLIVDDEAPGRANLRLALAAHPGWRLLAECDSAAAARSALAQTQADVIFLDIQMPQESGLALARELSRRAVPPLIIFVTAYDSHALDAFEVHALDYLLKPIDDRRLAQALERAVAMLAYRQQDGYRNALRNYADAPHDRYADALSVRSIGSIEQIKVEDILWLQSAGNYVELHLAARAVLHRVPLSRLEQLLRPDEFLRVHRTAIVRRTQIRRLSVIGDGRYELALACGAQLAVSERYVNELKACL
ncbi:two component transcriptional regulator, LytTR family [Duganella sp. CF402]|uniref:LytR/AlgR family response regulator transcription factor n=1 Tax=unclassified Duganella TaxID=2636909 RepID=UPI0008D89F69|nr:MULTISPECIES: LytTR family DNA-binding domain-containing protein [unclassified Duganella]RZT08129.1 LytTR family two component transcriptional regulator [Duganella sp. BK701]SEM04585.1 two component transcriptional regulator, LytTR family [Duganella sp. CF402]